MVMFSSFQPALRPTAHYQLEQLQQFLLVQLATILIKLKNYMHMIHQRFILEEKILTSSILRRGIWKKDNKSFSLTWVWRSGKQSLMFLRTSEFNCEHIDPLVQESLDVPSLLCSQREISLSLTVAIFALAQVSISKQMSKFQPM